MINFLDIFRYAPKIRQEKISWVLLLSDKCVHFSIHPAVHKSRQISVKRGATGTKFKEGGRGVLELYVGCVHINRLKIVQGRLLQGTNIHGTGIIFFNECIELLWNTRYHALFPFLTHFNIINISFSL